MAIELQIDNLETLKYYREYLQLKRENKIIEIRDELKDDFIAFYDLFKQMKSKFYSLEDFKEALAMDRKMNETEGAIVFLEMQKERTQNAVDKLNLELSELHKEISVANHELERLELIKRSLIVFVESRTQEKNYTNRNLPQLFD